MKNNKKNIAQIVESWKPAIKQITNNAVNESNPDKLQWMCEYAHNHVLNEDATAMTGGATFPFQTLYNTNGIGNGVPASMAGQTAVDQYNPNTFGSGDKWPSLLPMALQVAARTIGFDLVNTFPLQGPTGVIPFMDYVYAGSKDVYGATPSYDASSANPDFGPAEGNYDGAKKRHAYELYNAPHAFRCKLVSEDPSVKKGEIIKAIGEECKENEYIVLTNGDAKLRVQLIGLSRLSAEPMFKVMPGQEKVSLASIFGDENLLEGQTAGDKYKFDLKGARLISALEDQITGFTGAGKYDNDRWTGTYMNPFKLYEPMDRATGEMQYPRQMSLKVFTKFVQVGTQSVAVAVTQEMVQDLQKQWGIDVLKMVENAAINELSQSINKHILSRLFAMGWKNHVQMCDAEGINLNINLTEEDLNPEKFAFAAYDSEGEERIAMEIPHLSVYGTGAFENNDTVYKRVANNMLYAGNMIMQRGRRGPANFIVTNTKMATILQTNAQYAFSPYANTINQNNGSLYPAGTIWGITLYVDPMMANYDTRILVGRKGDKDEPGLAFCPYIMAESVRLIAEQTAAPKVLLKSRYALVDLGWYPWLNYVTFYVHTNPTL